MIHDLNHEILERHESQEVESNVIRNTESFHSRTGMQRNLSHRIPFVCFVYFVVNDPGQGNRIPSCGTINHSVASVASTTPTTSRISP